MKRKLIFLILFFFILPSTVFSITAEVKNISNRKYYDTLLENIEKAEKSIHVCVYYIAYYGKKGPVKDLMDALVNAKERGVDVLVILDQGNTSSRYTTHLKNERAFAYLLHHGIEVYYDDLKTTTHSKVIVIDKETVILGSTNWSQKSFNKSNEASLLATSQELAESYIKTINDILRTRPLMIKEGFSIPQSFFSKDIGGKLINKKSHRGLDLYLYVCKKAYHQEKTTITLNKEEIMQYIMYSLPPKSQSRFLYKTKEVTLKSLKKYKIIKNFQVDYKNDTVIMEIPSLEEATGVYLSDNFFKYGWHTRLSSKAKYAYLILLNETRNGALGRMVSFKSRDFFKKKYNIGRKTLTYAFLELQKFNLIERTVNFNTDSPKANDYFFNDIYSMEDFEVKLMELAHLTDEDIFKTAHETAAKLNEPYDIDVIKNFIDAIKKYGIAQFKKKAKHILKKSKLSPYRNPAFLLTMLRENMNN